MNTAYGSSRYDEKQSYVLDYTSQDHVLGYAGMRDEVREIGPGFYLCMGSWGWSERRRNQPSPFIMWGPKNAAVPDKFQEESGITIRPLEVFE